ncbi:MAG: exodeoxyribonuclease VII large subunit [Actinomycetota bacterium]|jgi:exodeoxyribonuclease VII large subunit|nr:exodeoxyribonuclease VII large subunit [Actinomycetota bacterium]
MIHPFFSEQQKIYKVSEINLEIKQNLESSYFDVWIEGEISNFAFPNKRHMYFTLKDDNSVLKVAFFENSIKSSGFFTLNITEESQLKDGAHVYVNGYVSIYDKRSEYQIIARNIVPVRAGSLLLAFEQMKKKLESKGLFDDSHKKKIPVLPQKIGLITSKNGAVIKDIIKILNKRFKNYNLILRNTPVQGKDAAEKICSAIDDLEEYGTDVIIIARGGGSFEDLSCFNDEELANRIFVCNIPIISGVGHQTDFTICDFVADIRAATPTHAAEIVILDKNEALQDIKSINIKFNNLLKKKIISLKREIFLIFTKSILKWPRIIINNFWQYYYSSSEELKNNIGFIISKNKKSYDILKSRINPLILKRKIIMDISSEKRLSSIIGEKFKIILNKKRSEAGIILERLKSSNPATILAKGYSITKLVEGAKLISNIEMVSKGDLIETAVQNGKIYSEVIKKNNY